MLDDTGIKGAAASELATSWSFASAPGISDGCGVDLIGFITGMMMFIITIIFFFSGMVVAAVAIAVAIMMTTMMSRPNPAQIEPFQKLTGS